ncbi:DUF1294 domain-containing protein [Bacillus salacetis]|uniref:DUF1294 domain-containing protein n=1 Tax=Bacillus salacetis TaxID=2315464 RepID=A0A3A1QRF3_9BACI|nr:DUF1294 domain-containing protein [Bacillus salacetis]RIW29735.1 DUF1294 domain-containing protein [Bacillus salacetis]
MTTPLTLLLAYFTIVNFMGYIIMANDKNRARQNKYRIRESSIWRVAFLGGAIGCYAGMKRYRHKTQHSAFKYGLPALSAVELITYTGLAFIIIQNKALF